MRLLDDDHYSSRGRHVQYGLVRTYVQIPELVRKSIFTTKSQITIGSNVPDPENAVQALTRFAGSSGKSTQCGFYSNLGNSLSAALIR